MIEGGTAPNILARDAFVTWEYRALPDRDPNVILARVRELAEREILPKYRAARIGSAPGDCGSRELSRPRDAMKIRRRSAPRSN